MPLASIHFLNTSSLLPGLTAAGHKRDRPLLLTTGDGVDDRMDGRLGLNAQTGEANTSRSYPFTSRRDGSIFVLSSLIAALHCMRKRVSAER